MCKAKYFVYIFPCHSIMSFYTLHFSIKSVRIPITYSTDENRVNLLENPKITYSENIFQGISRKSLHISNNAFYTETDRELDSGIS